MKKKVTGLSTLFLVLLLGLFTSSYAANVTCNQLDISVDANKEDIFDGFFEHYGFSLNNVNSTTMNTYETGRNAFISADYGGIIYFYNSSAGSGYQYSCEILNTSGVNNNTITSTASSLNSNSLGGFKNGHYLLMRKYAMNSMYYNEFSSYWYSAGSYTILYCAFQNSAGNWFEYSSDGWSMASVLRPTFDFLPDAEDIIQDPLGDDAYCIQPSQVSGYYKLGQFLNWDSIHPIDYQCVIISYENYSTSGEIWHTTISDGNIYIDSNGVLWFNSLNLFEHYIYWFEFFRY